MKRLMSVTERAKIRLAEEKENKEAYFAKLNDLQSHSEKYLKLSLLYIFFYFSIVQVLGYKGVEIIQFVVNNKTILISIIILTFSDLICVTRIHYNKHLNKYNYKDINFNFKGIIYQQPILHSIFIVFIFITYMGYAKLRVAVIDYYGVIATIHNDIKIECRRHGKPISQPEKFINKNPIVKEYFESHGLLTIKISEDEEVINVIYFKNGRKIEKRVRLFEGRCNYWMEIIPMQNYSKSMYIPAFLKTPGHVDWNDFLENLKKDPLFIPSDINWNKRYLNNSE